MRKNKRVLLSLAFLAGFAISVPMQVVAASPEQAWVPGISNFDPDNNTGNMNMSTIETETNGVSSHIYQEPNFDKGYIAVNRAGDRAYLPGSLFGGLGSNNVDVINPHTNEYIATIELRDIGSGDVATVAVLNQDETKLYVGNGNQAALFVIDTATNTVIDSLNTDSGNLDIEEMSRPKFLDVAPDGTLWVLNENSGNGIMFQLDAETLDLLAGPFEMPRGTDPEDEYSYVPYWLNASLDGTKLYISCLADSTEPDTPAVESLCIYDIDANTFTHIETGAELASEPPIQIGDLALSPDGQRVYRPNHFDNTLSIISTLDDSLLETIEVGDTPAGVDITTDGSKLFVINSRFMESMNSSEFDRYSTVSVVETSSNQVMATISLNSILSSAMGNFIGGTDSNLVEEEQVNNPSATQNNSVLAETGDSEELFIVIGITLIVISNIFIRKLNLV